MAYELINNGPATPHRMHALIRLLARQDEWDRGDILDLVEPASLDAAQKVGKDVLSALRNLGIVEVMGETVRLDSAAKRLVDLELFRRYLVSSVTKARHESHENYRFTLFTSWYATRNEEVFAFGIDEMIMHFNNQIPFDSPDRAMNRVKFTAWQPLAAFLEYGWLFNGKLVPDATKRLRPEVRDLLPERVEVPFATFISRLSTACPELDHGELYRLAWMSSRSEQLGNRLSMMLSNALRRLHEEETIVLSRVPDAGDTWQLFPAAGYSLQEITHIRRGAKQ